MRKRNRELGAKQQLARERAFRELVDAARELKRVGYKKIGIKKFVSEVLNFAIEEPEDEQRKCEKRIR